LNRDVETTKEPLWIYSLTRITKMLKRPLIAILIAMLFHAPVIMHAQQTMWVHTGNVHWAYDTDTVGVMPYSSSNLLTVLEKGFTLSDIDSITVDETTFDDNNILVEYDDDAADVYVAGNIANYITATVTGANVTVAQNSSVADEITYTLQGETSSGYFYHTGSYKITLVLNGVNITSTTTYPAIWIKNGKRIAVEMASGTENYLTDASTNSKKACFLVTGHAEFSKGGNLTITGNKKHAFACNEYLEVKKSVGNINVKSSVGDAFNVVEYFQMNGGTVTVESCGDDGIQCDAESTTDPDADGHILIKGGTLTINSTIAATKSIKAEGSVTVSGGTLTINHSGDGEYDSDDSEVKSAYGIKSDRNVNIDGTDAVVEINMTGNGSRGIKCDSTFCMAAGTTTITCTGADCISNGDTASVKCVKSDLAFEATGGELTCNTTQDEAVGIHTEGTTTINGGVVNLNTYDHGLKSEGDISMNDGTVNFDINGAASKAIKAESNLYVSGGTISGTVSGGGETDSDNTTSASACIKCNGNITFDGGTFNLKATGDGDKGINCDGTITVNDGDFTITTTGERYGESSSSSSSSGGGFGPGTGKEDETTEDSNSTSSAKGIRAEGDITINGGNFVMSTTGGEGSEAIESKAVMMINDGYLEIESFDDGLNSSSHMYINGGHIYIHATDNDAMDSNGDMYINGGVIIVYGAGAPENALDVPDDYGLYITGGTLVGIGGGENDNISAYPTPNSCTGVQPSIIYTTSSITTGTTYLLRDGSGNNILAFTLTNEVNSPSSALQSSGSYDKMFIITSPSLSAGTSYTLYSGATVTDSEEEWHSMYISPTTSSTGSSVGTVSSLSTPYSTMSSGSRR